MSFRLAAAALALAATSYWLVARVKPTQPEHTATDMAFFYWQSPTASLLAAPDEYPSDTSPAVGVGGNHGSVQ